MKVLFLVPYPTSGASTRYRVEQFVPYLNKRGIECKVSPFISENFYKVIYKKGHYLAKLFCVFTGLVTRLVNVFESYRYDIIFIHLESFPIGPAFMESLFSLSGKQIIYDLDDAIYMPNRSFSNSFIKMLKCPDKISKIIKISSHVITCNNFLRNYALQYRKDENVSVIHTSVDTNRLAPNKNNAKRNGLVIGWIGSHSTSVYLENLRYVFEGLAKRHDFTLKIVGAGRELKFNGVKIINKEWSLQQDLADFQSIDIGIYPLNNDEWIKGKTGFKTIQYMSVGIPCVVSKVGSNLEIVQDGINGFLAENDSEWIDRLSRLIENQGLRKAMGAEGRKTAEEKYSVNVNAPRFFEIIQKAYRKRYS